MNKETYKPEMPFCVVFCRAEDKTEVDWGHPTFEAAEEHAKYLTECEGIFNIHYGAR